MTWYQVFDIAASIPPKGVRAYDWNNYTDLDGVVSIPNYLESNADRLRSRLLGLIHELGLIHVNGKSIVAHLAIEHDFSLWWMSLLTEKSIYKSPRLFDCLRLLALDELLRAEKPGGIELVSNDKVLADAIKNLCTELAIPFRQQHPEIFAAHPPRPLAKRLYYHLPRPMRASLWFVWHIIMHWRLRRVRSGLTTQNNADVTVFSYFIHLDTRSRLNGSFHSGQWGAVGELLNNNCGGANWFHHYIKSNEVPDVNTGVAWLERLNQDMKEQGRHQFLDSFLDFPVVLRALRNFFASNSAAWRLRNVKYELPVNGLPGWLWPLIKNDFWESINGPTAARNLLFVELFSAAIGTLPRQRLGFYLYENQGWEKAMIYAWHKYGHGQLIAVAHATIRYWDLRYFMDSRTFCEGNYAMPLPDKVAVNGPAAKNTLLAADYPMQRLIEVEAQRYLGLSHISAIRSAQPKISGDGKKRVLVLGDIMSSGNDAMMRLLQDLPADLKERLDFTVKPHPGCSIFPADYPPLIYKVAQKPLACLLGEYDIAYAANATSAALDALLGGLRIIVQYATGQINQSPLRGMRNVWFVATSEELSIALQSDEEITQDTLADSFFWLDQDLPKWQALINQQGAA